MKRKLFLFIAYLILAISLSVVTKTAYATPWRSPLITSFYGHNTDAWFDKANPDGTLIIPYENWTTGTIDYEWKDIDPHFHELPALGVVSYWYEAKDLDVNPQWHYVMNDFVGRTIDLGGTLDNWFYWEYGGHSWGIQLFGDVDGDGDVDVDDDPLRVWKDITLKTSIWGWPELDLSTGSRTYTSGISGAYKYDISPLMPDPNHTIFELAIPYDISPPLRDMIWFGDPLTSGEYYTYTYVPAPSALLLLGSGLAGVVGLRRKKLIK